MSEPDPYCLACGYSLAGLASPLRCPECGTIGDPAAQAREWYARQRWGLAWLWTGGPPAAAFALDDDESCRLARRRLVRRLVWPFAVTAVLALLGMSAEVAHEVRFLWNDFTAPLGGPRQPRTFTVERLQRAGGADSSRVADVERVVDYANYLAEYAIRAQIRVWSEQIRPASGHSREGLEREVKAIMSPEWRREDGPSHLRFAAPKWDRRLAACIGVAAIPVLGGLLPCMLLLRLNARTGPAGAVRSLRAGVSLVAAPLGIAIWMAAAAAVILAVGELWPESGWSKYLGAPILAGLLVAALNGVLVWWRLMALDRTGLLYRNKWGWGLLLGCTYFAGLAAAAGALGAALG